MSVYRLITVDSVENDKFERAEFKLDLHKKLLEENGEDYVVVGDACQFNKTANGELQHDAPLSSSDLELIVSTE